MSTVIDSIAGKGRTLGTNFWVVLLAVAGLVAILNTGYAGWKNARLGGASTAASSLQVNSQRLANLGREAVAGNAGAFNEFKQTKAAIDGDIRQLNANFGNVGDVSGAIGTVTRTWEPLAQGAEQVIASEQAVMALAGNAARF